MSTCGVLEVLEDSTHAARSHSPQSETLVRVLVRAERGQGDLGAARQLVDGVLIRLHVVLQGHDELCWPERSAYARRVNRLAALAFAFGGATQGAGAEQGEQHSCDGEGRGPHGKDADFLP